MTEPERRRPLFDEKGHRSVYAAPFLASASKASIEMATLVEDYKSRAFWANIPWEPIITEADRRSRESLQPLKVWLPIVWDEYLAHEWEPDHSAFFVQAPVRTIAEWEAHWGLIAIRPTRRRRLVAWLRGLPDRFRWWKEGS